MTFIGIIPRTWTRGPDRMLRNDVREPRIVVTQEGFRFHHVSP